MAISEHIRLVEFQKLLMSSLAGRWKPEMIAKEARTLFELLFPPSKQAQVEEIVKNANMTQYLKRVTKQPIRLRVKKKPKVKDISNMLNVINKANRPAKKVEKPSDNFFFSGRDPVGSGR